MIKNILKKKHKLNNYRFSFSHIKDYLKIYKLKSMNKLEFGKNRDPNGKEHKISNPRKCSNFNKYKMIKYSSLFKKTILAMPQKDRALEVQELLQLKIHLL